MLRVLFFGLLILVFFSCNRKVKNSISYISCSQEFDIQEIQLKHVGFRSVLFEFEQSVKIFERGVNLSYKFDIDYYITASSFCKNDSSFVVLRAKAGSYFFYNLSDELDPRWLDQLGLVEGKEKQILIFKDLERKFCEDNEYEIENSLLGDSRSGKFCLNWYKDDDGWLLDFYPYFYDTYYFDGKNFVLYERNFPNRITVVK